MKVYKPWNESLDGDVCRRAAYDVYIPQFNLLGLRESVIMLRTSTCVINTCI